MKSDNAIIFYLKGIVYSKVKFCLMSFQTCMLFAKKYILKLALKPFCWLLTSIMDGETNKLQCISK